MQDLAKFSAMIVFTVVAGVAIAACVYHANPDLPVYLHTIPAFGLGALITLYIAHWMDSK